MLKTAKKAAALFTSLMMITSCGISDAFVNFATVTASAASGSTAPANTMTIKDQNGNDISSNPIVYVDTTDFAGGPTSAKVTVNVSNGTSFCDDGIVVATEAFPKGKEVYTVDMTSTGQNSAELTINAGTTAGTSKISLSTESGEVYRTITVVAYEPATDMQVFLNDKKTEISFDSSNIGGILAIANHKYQLLTTIKKPSSTDVVEWSVYEGNIYSPSELATAEKSSKAEITDDGLFTPNSNGAVTIAAKFKPTETSSRTAVYKLIQVTIAKENPATSITFENAPQAMEAGEKLQLEYTATPTYNSGDGYETGATDEFVWTTSNPKVITVDSKGLITAIGKGTAKITIQGENKSASVDIKVLTKATSISIKTSDGKTAADTRIGVGTELIATMSPDTADEEIVWKSSDPSIATVKSTTEGDFTNVQTAVVTGVKTGTVTITATAKNSGKTATITVTVGNRIEADNLTLSINGNEIVSNSTVNVFTTKLISVDAKLTDGDGNTSDDTIVWSEEGNEEYAEVTHNGNQLTAQGIAVGKIKVTASAGSDSNIYKTFYINVLRSSSSMTFIDNGTDKACTAKTLNADGSFSLSPNLTIPGASPYDHDDSVVSWTSSNENVAVVENGSITGLNIGTTKITATAASGRTATCNITVIKASDIIINGVTETVPYKTVTLNKDGVGKTSIAATVYNQNGTTSGNVDISWESSDEDVVTIENGQLIGHTVGNATITARFGKRSVSCPVYVVSNISTLTNDPIEPIFYSPIIKEYTPKPVFTFLGKTLIEGTDYTLTYLNNTKVGTGTIKVTGIGKYIGEKTITFQIKARQITDPEVTLPVISKQQCTGSAITPAITVKCSGVTMIKDTDYTVTYTGNIKPGTATVTISGRGNYGGSTKITFEIYCNHTNVELVRVTKEATCQQTGTKQVKCKACGQTIEQVIPKTAHKYVTSVVKPTYTSDGYTLHKCSVCGSSYRDKYTAALTRINLSKCKISMQYTICTYNGYAKKPVMTVTYNGKKLVSGTDYYVSYLNNIKPGTATVRVTGMGKYTGTISKTFGIAPATVKASTRFTYATNAVRINWTKVTGASGYRIYRYNTSTKRWTTIATIYGGNTVTYRNAGLKSGTAYKYKVKAFVKSGSNTYWGTASSTINTATAPSKTAITKFSKASTAVRVYWNKVTCSGYKIQQSTDGGKTWKTVAKTASTVTNVRISGLKRNTVYRYRVQAYKSNGAGAYTYSTVSTVKAVRTYR